LVDASASLIDKGNYTGAITNLDKVLTIEPKNLNALIEKGVALDSLGNHAGGIQYYNKALSVDPKDEDALNAKKQALAVFNNQTTTSRPPFPHNQTTTAQ
jgi:Flp pilus assembly protein TadD